MSKPEESSIWAGMIDSAPIALIALDPQRQVAGWNAAAERLYGWTAGQAVGQVLDDLLQTDYGIFSRAEVELVTSQAGSWAGQVTQQTKDGRRIVISSAVSFASNEAGGPAGFVVANQPAPSKTPSEPAHASPYSAAFQSGPLALAITTTDTRYVEVNQAFSKLSGYAPEEILGRTPNELGLIGPAEQKQLADDIRRAGGSVRDLPIQIRARDGSLHHLLVSTETITLAGITHYLSTAVDITRRRQAERQLAQMKRLYATLSQVNQAIVQVKDPAGLYQSICEVAVQHSELSLAWLGLLDEASGNVTQAAAAGAGLTQFPYPNLNIRQNNAKPGLIACALQTGQVVTCEDLQTEPQLLGRLDLLEELNYHASAAVPFHIRGKAVGVLLLISSEVGWFKAEEETHLLAEIGQNLSFALTALENENEKKEVEKNLRKWADAFENCAHGIALSLAGTNRILTCNPAYARQQGRTVEEITSLPILSMYLPQDHERVQTAYEEADRTGRVQYEAHMVRKNGQVYPVQMDVVSVRDAAGEILYRVATLQDITQRKLAEESLQANQQMLELFVLYAPAAIAMLDRDLKYLAVSRRYLADYHLPEQNVIGRSHYEVFPDLPERWREVHRRCLAGAIEKAEEDPFPRQDGTLDWVRWEIHPWYAKPGEVGGLVLFSEVITDRIRAKRDLQQANEDLMLIKNLNDAVNRGLDIDGIAQALAQQARTVFNCQDVAIYLLGPNGAYLELQTTTIPERLAEHLEKLIRRPIPKVRIRLRENSLFKQLLDHEQGQIINDPHVIQQWIEEFAETTFLPPVFRAGIKMLIPQIFHLLKINSIITIPLISSGRTIGLLDLSSENQLTEADLNRVRTLCHQVTTIILRKQTERQVQLQLKRLRALSEIDLAITSSLDLHLSLDILLSEVISQLEVDAADVLILKPATQMLEYAAGKGFRTTAIQHTNSRLGEGFPGQVGLERRVLHVADLPTAGSQFKRAQLLQDEDFIEYYGVPLIAKGTLKGVLEVFHRSSLEIDSEWVSYLETLGGQAAIAIDNAQLFEGMQQSNLDLMNAYDATIMGWSRSLDLYEREPEGHTQRVTDLTLELADRFGMGSKELVHIRRGALLHDIGKLGVPDQILFKPAHLTPEEWVLMRQHPIIAYNLLMRVPYLHPALDIPYCHHEKWDGSGYPRGLSGEQIPLAARLFAVVDVWDALRSERPYRARWSASQARAYILDQSGKHFDPRVVKIFLSLIENE